MSSSKKTISKKKSSLSFSGNYIYGVHPVKVLLERGYSFKRALIQKNITSPLQQTLIDYCKRKNINFFFAEKEELNSLTDKANHQGFAIETKSDFSKVEDLDFFLEKLSSKEKARILILDQITDQHNLGAIARSAYFFGCDLIILEKKNSAPINHVVHKISAGASLLLPFYVTEKISRSINTLKEKGYQILATVVKNEDKSIPIKKMKDELKDKLVFLFGSEGNGVRPHLLRQANKKIYLDSENDFDSLNVSVTAGIFLHELYSR